MPGENGRGRPPETIHVEDERQRELREMKERANRTIETAYGLLCERFENPSDETVNMVIAEMLLRPKEEVPDHLRVFAGLDVTEIPEDVFEETRELLKMPFHKKEHSQEVVSRTVLILEEMQNGGVELSAEEFELARIIAAGHDLVQRWKTVQHDNGKLERKRYAEENERASADELIELLRQKGFTNFDEDVVREAFDATIPSGWDGKTVVQTFLTPESHPIVRAVALADLGAAGMDPDSFMRGGDQLFVEENLDMLHLDAASLSEDQKVAYADRMLKWCESQIGFARGRKERFEEDMGELPEGAKVQLRGLFSRFDDSIVKAQEHLARRKGLSFEDLYASMGFV